jgi:acylphosphatase
VSEAGDERLTAIVRGHVQGVGFRWFVERSALRLGLTGWVRNREDRTVEVVAEGPPEVLDRLAAALQEGPPGARVEHVGQRRDAATGAFQRFSIRSGWHPGD